MNYSVKSKLNISVTKEAKAFEIAIFISKAKGKLHHETPEIFTYSGDELIDHKLR